jgi:hypothetical protein
MTGLLGRKITENDIQNEDSTTKRGEEKEKRPKKETQATDLVRDAIFW